jgi:hypothetical protein
MVDNSMKNKSLSALRDAVGRVLDTPVVALPYDRLMECVEEKRDLPKISFRDSKNGSRFVGQDELFQMLEILEEAMIASAADFPMESKCVRNILALERTSFLPECMRIPKGQTVWLSPSSGGPQRRSKDTILYADRVDDLPLEFFRAALEQFYMYLNDQCK